MKITYEKFRDVLVGVYRYINPNYRKYKLLYRMREKSCYSCELSNYGRGNKCSGCGCFIKLKVKSVTDTNDCPLGKWLHKSRYDAYPEVYYNRGKRFTCFDMYMASIFLNKLDEQMRKEIKQNCTRKYVRYFVNSVSRYSKFDQLFCFYLIHYKGSRNRRNQFKLRGILQEYSNLSFFNRQFSDYIRKKR